MARFDNRDIIQGVSEDFRHPDDAYLYGLEVDRIINHNERLKTRRGITQEDIARIDTIKSTLRNNATGELDEMEVRMYAKASRRKSKHKSKRTNKKRKTKRRFY